MPVDIESDLWTTASSKASTKADILNFLESNSDQAFTAEEVCREVLDDDFEIDIPEEKLPTEEMIGQAIASTQLSAYTEAFLKTHLSSLVYEGELEVRLLPVERGGEKIEMPHSSVFS